MRSLNVKVAPRGCSRRGRGPSTNWEKMTVDDSTPCRIPLRNRAGEVVAWARVSPEDFDDVNAYRWYVATRGYAARQYRHPDTKHTRAELMHRRILGLERGDKRQADHINRDKLDNRRENLRIVTQAQNNRNIVAGRGRSGVHGVHWDAVRGRWMARVQFEGKQHWLGHFDTIEEAAAVAAEWRRQNVPHSAEAAR